MKHLLSTLLFSLIAITAFSQDKGQPGYIADSIDEKIKEMIEVSGGQAGFDVAIDQMIEMQKSAAGEVSDGFWDEFNKEIKGEAYYDLYEMLIPIYKKHLTEEEVDAAITYYKSPLGKSLVTKNPLIMQESMQVGYQWGEKVGKKIMMKMEENKN